MTQRRQAAKGGPKSVGGRSGYCKSSETAGVRISHLSLIKFPVGRCARATNSTGDVSEGKRRAFDNVVIDAVAVKRRLSLKTDQRLTFGADVSDFRRPEQS